MFRDDAREQTWSRGERGRDPRRDPRRGGVGAWDGVGRRGTAWGTVGRRGTAWGGVGQRGAPWDGVGHRGAPWDGAHGRVLAVICEGDD